MWILWQYYSEEHPTTYRRRLLSTFMSLKHSKRHVFVSVRVFTPLRQMMVCQNFFTWLYMSSILEFWCSFWYQYISSHEKLTYLKVCTFFLTESHIFKVPRHACEHSLIKWALIQSCSLIRPKLIPILIILDKKRTRKRTENFLGMKWL